MRVIVVGAGIAGLGAATYASKAGHDVLVLEAQDQVGGRAKTYTRPGTGDVCDVGTQYYHSSYTRALGLMRELGLEKSLSKIVGGSRFFDDRARKGSFVVGHRLPWFEVAGIGGNMKLGWHLLKAALGHRFSTFELEDQAKLDSIPASEAFEDPILWEFMVRSLTVAGAITEPEPTGLSLLHALRLIRIIVLTDYLSLEGGNLRFHEGLADRLDVRTGSPVGAILEDGGRVSGVELAGSGEALKADHVVVATTPPAALRFVPQDWTEERSFLDSVTIPPFAFPTIFLDRPLEKGVWSYMSRWQSGAKISCILDAAQKNPKMTPSGNAILQPWAAYPAWEAWKDLDDSGITNACLAELEEWFPGISSWVEHVEVTRHPASVPWHPVGHNQRALAFLDAVDRRPGVAFCGDYLSGGYLEPALWAGERAVSGLD